MHDFGSFCYLDVQKTGSSFISQFLRKNASVPEVHFAKHARINKPAYLRPGKLFFISARAPLDLYKSLYFFGVGNKGALRSNLARQDDTLAQMYDGTAAGFRIWLKFVLKPRNHAHLGQGYGAQQAALYGFMTYRFLALSFYKPSHVLGEEMDRAALTQRYLADKLHGAIIRNESLNHDLAALIDRRLRDAIADPDEAIARLRTTDKRINVSTRADHGEALKVGPDLLARLRAREWFFYDVLGYRADGGA